MLGLWELELACLDLNPFHCGEEGQNTAGQRFRRCIGEADKTFLGVFLNGDATRSVHLASLVIKRLLQDLGIQNPMRAGSALFLDVDLISFFAIRDDFHRYLLAQRVVRAITQALIMFSTNTVAAFIVAHCFESADHTQYG